MILDKIYSAIGMFYKAIKKTFSIAKNFIFVMLLVFIVTFSFGWAALHNLYDQSRVDEYKILSNINEGTFHRLMNTEIYDANENKIGEIKATDFEYTDIKDISPLIQEGYIAVEDTRFKEHNGIDLKGLARAGVMFIKNRGHITQGGSTITQQVVKNTLLTQERTFSRKAVEALLALDIEKKFTKADIMEFYLNSCYYGNGCYGVGSACRYYFGCKPDEVTAGQAALLIGISNNPNNVNPVASEERAKEKRSNVLKKMKNAGVISESVYETANKENITPSKITTKNKTESYQTSYAVYCATIELMKRSGFQFQYTFEDKKTYNSYKEKYKKNYQKYSSLIRSGGYKIYTSFDAKDQTKLQNAVDTILSEKSKRKSDDGRYLLQGAAVSINNKSGYITAIVGGRGTKDQYNRAFLSSRQSGSVIKPLLDYGPAFDTGKYFPSLIVEDEPIENGPKNSNGRYAGKVSIRQAIQNSINTVAYKTLQNTGIKNGLSYLDKMEFSTLSYLDNNSSAVALGGFTNGVHVTDMARGYACLANNGAYRERTCIKKNISELDGTVYTENNEVQQIYDEASAYMLTSCMQDAITKGTGKGIAPNGQIVAGKTGTTNDMKDGWFCGYSADTTCAVWVGNDDNTPVSGNYGATYAGKIWSVYMKSASEGKKEFNIPETIQLKYVDQDGYMTETETKNQDIFSISKEKTMSEQKLENELRSEKATAEKFVSKLENFHIDTLEDYYNGYEDTLKAAQDAVAAISDDKEQKPYLERINTKVLALEEEKKGWSDVSDAKSDYEKQKESDRQAKIKKEQEEKNQDSLTTAQVNRFKSYINMINELDVYSDTMQKLLTNAQTALNQINDSKTREEMQKLYDDASKYVNSLKEDSEFNEDTEEEE